MIRKVFCIVGVCFLLPQAAIAETYKVTVRDVPCGSTQPFQVSLPANLNVSDLRISATTGLYSQICASNTGNGDSTASALFNFSVAPQFNIETGFLQPLAVISAVPVVIEDIASGQSECRTEKTRARTIQPFIDWSAFLDAGHTYNAQVLVHCTVPYSLSNGNGIVNTQARTSIQLLFEDRQ